MNIFFVNHQKVVAPLLKNIRNPPDYLEEYSNEYGFLGPALHSAVVKARITPPPITQPNPSILSASSVRTSNQTLSGTPAATRTLVVTGNQTRPVISGTGQQQKYLFLARPPAPNSVRFVFILFQ